MTRQPRVSVLLTSYNREKYIAASIESVLAQTFEDFELLITDNQSTDASVDIARAYERLDSRVRVIVNERNLGQFGNRNRAAAHARGEFLKYHDSDDIMYSHCLSTMVTALAAEPRAGFGLTTGRAWSGGPCPMLLTPRMSYQREFLGFGLFMCSPSGAIYRADVFRALGGFEDYGIPSDHIFWLKACARYPALLLPADLFWYRTHPDQEFQSERAALEYAIVPGHAWRALGSPECPLEPAELEVARRNHTFGTAKAIWLDARAGRWRAAARRVRRSGLTIADWLRYLRFPRRSALAGTPLTTTGEYVVPETPADLSAATRDQHSA